MILTKRVCSVHLVPGLGSSFLLLKRVWQLAHHRARAAMSGQFLMNRAITMSYAYKKDQKGERHGTDSERLLATQNPVVQNERPHQVNTTTCADYDCIFFELCKAALRVPAVLAPGVRLQQTDL